MSTVKTIGAPNFAPKRSPSRLLTFRVGLLLILLLAAGLRLYQLGVYPQIFDQDEQVMGYDAWSLWQTGHDHHGALLPVFFQTFDDYVPPVSNYITAPFVGILGLDQATTRLPMALMGIATVGLVALLGRRWFGAPAGLAAALFLAIDPWHVNYSRIAFPSDAIPFFTTLALYTFTCALAALSCAEHGTCRRTDTTNTLAACGLVQCVGAVVCRVDRNLSDDESASAHPFSGLFDRGQPPVMASPADRGRMVDPIRPVDQPAGDCSTDAVE